MLKFLNIEQDNVTGMSGNCQIIKKTTKSINEFSSCIDLIFSSDVNPIKTCGGDKHFMKYVTTISSIEL